VTSNTFQTPYVITSLPANRLPVLAIFLLEGRGILKKRKRKKKEKREKKGKKEREEKEEKSESLAVRESCW